MKRSCPRCGATYRAQHAPTCLEYHRAPRAMKRSPFHPSVLATKKNLLRPQTVGRDPKRSACRSTSPTSAAARGPAPPTPLPGRAPILP